MLFSVPQLIAHFIGDYLLQSHWMATSKRARSMVCLCHVFAYGLAFILVGTLNGRTIAGREVQTLSLSWRSYVLIVGTHFVIDRWGLARYVCAFKNWLLGPLAPQAAFGWFSKYRKATFGFYWRECVDQTTGFPIGTPPFLAVWLLIICDNIMHVVINAFALWCL